MSIYKPPNEPKPTRWQIRWEGKHITYFSDTSMRRGQVLEASEVELENGCGIMLRVLRDDGFVEPGVRAEWVMREAP